MALLLAALAFWLLQEQCGLCQQVYGPSNSVASNFVQHIHMTSITIMPDHIYSFIAAVVQPQMYNSHAHTTYFFAC